MRQKGQALILFLVFSALAVSVLTTAVVSAITNARNSLRSVESQKAFSGAEAGLEEGIIAFMRNPTSCSGQRNLVFLDASVVINFTQQASECLISSEAIYGNSKKRVEISVHYDVTEKFILCCYQQLP